MSPENTLKRRGILFLYGAEWCNPNGDPAFDNEPRIRGGRIYVTDVFLKRRLRDYVYFKYKDEKEGKIVLIREVWKGDKLQPLPERVKEVAGEEPSREYIEILKRKCWDIRVFGGLITLETAKEKGKSKKESEKGEGEEEKEKYGGLKLIGPVQASFGISLNTVEKITVEITRVLPTGEKEAKAGGAIGQKHVVPVAIVEQYLFVNDITARETLMTEEDYKEIIDGLKNFGFLPTTKTTSKNLWPIIIIEIEFVKDRYGNLMGLLEVEERKENPSTIRDYYINAKNLVEKLKELEEKKVIENYKIYIKEEYKDIIKELNVEKDRVEYF